MLCNAWGKYQSCPGITLLLGSILHYRPVKHPPLFPPGLVASLYLVRQQKERHILDDMEFSGIISTDTAFTGTREFLAYFIELLENPERSGTRAFDQQSYTTAAKECLQLWLCSHRKFSNEATESACRDRELRRNKPWTWRARLGIHSRTRRAARHLTVQRRKLLKSRRKVVSQFPSPPLSPSEHEDYQFLAYQWGLDTLPFLLEESAISLELADVLRTRTFAMMAQESPREMKSAKAAITAYLLRVESVVGSPWITGAATEVSRFWAKTQFFLLGIVPNVKQDLFNLLVYHWNPSIGFPHLIP